MNQIPKEIREAMKLRDELAMRMNRLETQWRAAQYALRKQQSVIDQMWIDRRREQKK